MQCVKFYIGIYEESILKKLILSNRCDKVKSTISSLNVIISFSKYRNESIHHALSGKFFQ